MERGSACGGNDHLSLIANSAKVSAPSTNHSGRRVSCACRSGPHGLSAQQTRRTPWARQRRCQLVSVYAAFGQLR
eukprot:6008854-Alexandrium_andersonii.AAC.1